MFKKTLYIYIYIMFKKTGNRTEVMNGLAEKTGGGLRKNDLKYNKYGKIVSKRMSTIAKKENRLQKGGVVSDYKKRIKIINKIEIIVNNIENLSISQFKDIIYALEDTLNYVWLYYLNKDDIHELAKKAFHIALKTVGENMQKQANIRETYLKFRVKFDSSDAIGRNNNSSDAIGRNNNSSDGTAITTKNMNKIVSANKNAIEQLIFKKYKVYFIDGRFVEISLDPKLSNLMTILNLKKEIQKMEGINMENQYLKRSDDLDEWTMMYIDFDYILDPTITMEVEVFFKDVKHILNVPCLLLTLSDHDDSVIRYYDAKMYLITKAAKYFFNIPHDTYLNVVYMKNGRILKLSEAQPKDISKINKRDYDVEQSIITDINNLIEINNTEMDYDVEKSITDIYNLIEINNTGID